jgi:hypothetical protein
MMFGPRARISPSSATLSSTPGIAWTVHGEHRRGLGQAVAFVDLDSSAPEELGDVGRQGRAPGDREFEAPAEARADLAEHQLVGEGKLDTEHAGGLLAPQPVGYGAASDAARPFEDLLLRCRAPGDVLEHLGQHFLVDPGYGDEHVRPDFEEVLGYHLDGLRVGDGDPAVEVDVVDRALEGVRQREEGEGRLAALDRHALHRGQDVARHVAVGEHHALRSSGRAAGVDEGRQIVGFDGADAPLHLGGVHRVGGLEQSAEGGDQLGIG